VPDPIPHLIILSDCGPRTGLSCANVRLSVSGPTFVLVKIYRRERRWVGGRGIGASRSRCAPAARALCVLGLSDSGDEADGGHGAAGRRSGAGLLARRGRARWCRAWPSPAHARATAAPGGRRRAAAGGRARARHGSADRQPRGDPRCGDPAVGGTPERADRHPCIGRVVGAPRGGVRRHRDRCTDGTGQCDRRGSVGGRGILRRADPVGHREPADGKPADGEGRQAGRPSGRQRGSVACRRDRVAAYRAAAR
jgi:hypothetical protein